MNAFAGILCAAAAALGAATSCGRSAPASTTPTVDTASASVNGTRLYYEVSGHGPTVVLLQGGNVPLEMWDDQFVELARSFHVVRYDARGFGRSAPKSGPFTSHDDLLALMRHLRIATASLVGLSLGGRVAIDFALEHARKVVIPDAGHMVNMEKPVEFNRAVAGFLGTAEGRGD